jgi:hypothetical protein
MPEKCPDCNFESEHGFCLAKSPDFCGYTDELVRPDWCPLVDLGKHGDLIDRDAFKSDYGMKDDCADCEKELRGKVKACEYDRIYSKMDFCGWLDDADVVIEAENGS